MSIKTLRFSLLFALLISGIATAMDSGQDFAEGIQENLYRAIRPDQLIEPDRQPQMFPGFFRTLQTEVSEFYTTEQSIRLRLLRAMCCIPLFLPCLCCYYGLNHLRSGAWLSYLQNFSRQDGGFRSFLRGLASDNGIEISRFDSIGILNIWLSWIRGRSDDISIEFVGNEPGQRTVSVTTNQNIVNRVLNVNTEAIRHRVVTFREAESTYILETFDALISIIFPYESGIILIVYQARNYIRVLDFNGYRDFSVTGDLQAVMHTELDQRHPGTDVSPPLSRISHYLVRHEQGELEL